jgi:phosphatidate cytidylyltransferase
MTEPTPNPKPSDLKVRVRSAIVMVAVAGVALWQGGWVFSLFVFAVGLGVCWEWWGLISKIAVTIMGRMLWMFGGLTYVSLAINGILKVRFHESNPIYWTIWLFALVVATDVGAYFFGRGIGGPKIAPSISPSKTWAGLFGGVVCAGVVMDLMFLLPNFEFKGLEAIHDISLESLLVLGILWSAPFVVVAQSGDFFESWMKRRAGVKDSGALIPGHGGLFDRVDGLLPVAIIFSPLMDALTY